MRQRRRRDELLLLGSVVNVAVFSPKKLPKLLKADDDRSRAFEQAISDDEVVGKPVAETPPEEAAALRQDYDPGEVDEALADWKEAWAASGQSVDLGKME